MEKLGHDSAGNMFDLSNMLCGNAKSGQFYQHLTEMVNSWNNRWWTVAAEKSLDCRLPLKNHPNLNLIYCLLSCIWVRYLLRRLLLLLCLGDSENDTHFNFDHTSKSVLTPAVVRFVCDNWLSSSLKQSITKMAKHQPLVYDRQLM